MKTKILILIFSAICFHLTACSAETKKEYHSNGNVKQEFFLKNGEYDGPFKSYYNNGQLRAEGHYQNGKEFGKWKYYFPDGKIHMIQSYDDDSLIIIECWDKNGTKIASNGTGIVKIYSDSGDLLRISSYENNLQHGKDEAFFPNGNKSSERYFNKGKPTGTWKYWNSKGELIKEENYNSNKQ